MGSAFQILGWNVRFPGTDSGNQDVLNSGPSMAATITGELVSITILVVTAAGHLRVGVYSDSGGLPDALLGESLSTVAVAGWQEIPLIAPAGLTVGQPFWLATLIEDNGLENSQQAEDGIQQGMELEYFRTGVSYAGGMPDPFGTPDGNGTKARTMLCRINPT